MTKKLKIPNPGRCIGCNLCAIVCSSYQYKSHSITKSAIRIKTEGGLEGQFVIDACIGCNDPPCAAVCPTDALSPREGGGVTLDEEQCIGCRQCIKACVVDAIWFDKEKNVPIVCKQCGICTLYCPHGCISFEEVEVE